MSGPTEVLDITPGQVGAVEVATLTIETVGVITGTLAATGGGQVSSPQVLSVVSVQVGAAAVDTTAVGAVDVIMGRQGPPGDPGPAGPVGPLGPSGAVGSAAAVQKGFAVASRTWEFVHNLGFAPFVQLSDSGGAVITGAIEVNTDTVTRVAWFYPVAGSMALL